MASATVGLAATVQQACAKVGHDRTRLMDILWEVQRERRCVNREAMQLLAAELDTYQVVIEGLVSFYAFFSETLKGQIIIRLCDDIVDQFAGLDEVTRAFSEALGIAP
jgi:[NiFe] hydrogenase diaphorase moiety large subunit